MGKCILTYEEAQNNREKQIIRGRFYKADVYLTRSNIGERFIIKDFSQKGFLEKHLIGRIVIGREARAYSALAGTAGFPRYFVKLSPFTIALEYLEGLDLGSIDRGTLHPEVICQFEKIVNELHHQGWVHLDLHRRTNILLVSGKIFIIDLASAVHTGSVPLIGRIFTRLFGIADRLSLIKIKTVFAPELITARERKLLLIRNWIMPAKW